MLSSSDDEDDPVVKEIDMYLAKGLAEKLFLFQYPVRPSSATYDFTPHLGARIKPVQQKVELELGIDTNSSTYCYPRGEQIAHAVDRDDLQGTTQKQHFPANVMDRQCLSSVKATEDSSKYAAAIYSNNTIHISPIKGIFQLHPSFTYFDKAEENQKKDAANLTSNDEGQAEEEDEAKLVQLRFSKAQNQKKKDQVTKQMPVEEKWVETHFYQCNDRRAVMERNLLLCHQDDFESPEFTVTSRDYLQILSPSEQQGAESPADLPHGVLSLLKLKGMSLTDQIKALLITAKVLQFTQLCALLGGGMNITAVLSGLTQYAMLVQGCWVVKSNVLYPEGTKSHVSGLDAAKLWPSRDYVMFCFNRKRVLSRKEVASNTRLPTEELREVLEQMGKQRPAQGWEFMLNTDNEFLEGNPEECTSQLFLWKQKYKELAESLHLSEEFSESDWNEKNFPGLFPGTGRKSGNSRNSRRRLLSQSGGSGSESEKPKSKGRSRTKSQCSQDGSDVEIKSEQVSPKRKFQNKPVEGRLTTSYNDKSAPNKDISQKTSNVSTPPTKAPKTSIKESNPNFKSIIKKESNDANVINSSPNSKQRKASHQKGNTNPDSKLKPDINTTISVHNIQGHSGDNRKKYNLDAMEVDHNVINQSLNSQNNIGIGNEKTTNSEVMETVDIKPDIDNINKHVHFTENNQQKNVSIINSPLDVEMIDEDIVVGRGKRKKKIAAIVSDDDESGSEISADINKIPTDLDLYMEDSNKAMNEVEVGPININIDENIYNTENCEEIFVPPMLAGRTISDELVRPPSDIFIKELKKFCHEAIQSGSLSLMELKEVLHMRQQEPGNILCTGVSDELLVKSLKESGAFEIPIRWSEPNNIPTERKRIFIYRHLGENTDKFRSVVIDLFCKSQSLRRKDIFEAFTKILNEVPSTHTYTKFLSEFCQNHHGQWYLNGTYPTIKKYSNL